MAIRKKAVKRDFTFNLSRTISQHGDLVISARTSQEAEALFEARFDEGDEFDDVDWSNGEVEGQIDWERDFEDDAEED